MTAKNKDDRKFMVTVFRYDPATDNEGRYETYQVPASEGLTILGALTYICDNIDSSLAYSYSCVCGECRACMVQVNGRPVKSCMVKLSRDVKIGPLPGREIVRDLVVIDKELVSDRRLKSKSVFLS